ncbi:MAG: right-handed parallel beta-helix repeat-containing protein, partial [candidate division WOR-3 bacterium]
WVLDSSEIFGSGWNWDQADNINVYTRNITIRHNLIHSSDGSSSASDIRIFASGIEVRYSGDSAKIYENTIYNNATKGIFVDGSSKYVEIVGNVIFGNGWRLPGPGVGVGERGGNSKYVLISRNSFSSNGGLAIDLDSTGVSGSAGDGVTCNDNLRQTGNPNELIDYPYIDSARVVISPSDTSLYVWGRAYTGADSVEIYLVSTPDMFNCSGEVNGHGEGGLFLGALRVVLNEFSGVISLNGLGVNWFSPQMIAAISRDNQMNTSEFSQNYPLPSPLDIGDELSIYESIEIENPGNVSVYSVDGRLIYKGKFKGFKGKAGIYFIKTWEKTFKVIIQP